MISRTTQSLLGAVGVLALAVGIAEVHPPTGQAAVSGTTVSTSVQNSDLVCPPTLQGVGGATTYSFAVPGPLSGTAASGSASLTGLPGTAGGAALATQTTAGGSTTAHAGSAAQALVATASGGTAPGFTVQQTTTAADHAISGTGCTAPGTDFWFSGADSDKGSSDYIELTNAEDSEADAEVQIFNSSGEVEGPSAASISVAADSTTSVLLSTLLGPGNENTFLAVHVTVHTGRVAAALHADSGSKGADWLPATVLGTTQVIPGLPGDITDATLVLDDPGSADADLNIQLATQNGWIVPAGHETVQVKAGMATSVDLGSLDLHNQPVALRLTPADRTQPSAPIVAGLQVVRSSGGSTDVGYLAGTAPIGQRATAAGNTAGESTLMLTAAAGAATVTVNSIGSSGTPVSQTVQIPAGSTVPVPLKAPSGSSGDAAFAVTVVPVSGGPVYAARMIGSTSGPGFTVQELPDDHSTVEIPRAVEDGSILMP
jgi:hypothetical protein